MQIFRTLLQSSVQKVMKFIDIGANLTDPMFQGLYNGTQKHPSDLDHVLQRAYNAGMEKIIITVGSREDIPRAKDISASDDRLFITVGVHPTRCNEFEPDPDGHLTSLSSEIDSNRSKVVAIGEIGLDYDRLHFCEKETQKKFFEKQLELANRFNLPVFLHCRNAHEDLLEILQKQSEIRGVVHTFDGTPEQAERILDLGLYLGINGCSLKTEDNLKAAAQIPDERILIETDAPWCEIRPSHAGSKHIKTKFEAVKKKEKWEKDKLVAGRCEPVQIVQVLEVLAGIKGKSVEELSEIYHQNTLKLFFDK